MTHSTPKRNWFDSLNEALGAENLIELWPLGTNVNYHEVVSVIADNGTKYGHLITIFRDGDGRYERPVHYNC